MSATATGSGHRVGRVGVVGLGLIGGSLLRCLSERGVDAVGYNRGADNREAARSAGLAVEEDLARLARKVDLLVVAVPLDALTQTLRYVAAAASDGTVITDVTSVKSRVRVLARQAAPTLRFVGGHPMAGTEHSGFAASSADLFVGAPWVVCDEEDTDPQAWASVAWLVSTAGATVVRTTSAAHDLAAARISHLPHVLAAALASGAVDPDPPEVAALALALAAGSFRDGTRVAATRPELSASMCSGNAEALLSTIDVLLARLARVRDDLVATPAAGTPTDGLVDFFARGREARRSWEAGIPPSGG